MSKRYAPIRNLSQLTIGNAIGYGLTVILLPLLTRTYSPADFGNFALLFGLTQVCGLAVTLRLEKAIFISKSREESKSIAQAAYINTIIGTALSAGIVALYFAFSGHHTALLYLPLTLICQSVILIETASGNHQDRYTRSAIARGLQGAGPSIAALILATLTTEGLIYGFAISQALAAAYLLLSRSKDTTGESEANGSTYFKTLSTHRNFALFTAPHEISGSLSAQATTFLIPIYFGSVLAGIYFIAQKCIMLPSILFGGSSAQVYYHELTKVREIQSERIQLFNTTLRLAGVSSLLIFGTIYIFAPSAVSIIFGDAWTDAGAYGRILAPWAALHLIGSILSQTPQALNAQKTAMLLEFANFSLRLGMLTLGYLLGNAALGITLFIAVSIAFTGGRILWYSNLIHRK